MPVRKATFAICVGLNCSILYLILHYVTNSIYQIVKQPYMDEIFHIPQAQRYCKNNFTHYDPKLTTPPGLYLLAYARIWLRDKVLIQRKELVCDTIDLRRTNHLMAIFNFVIIVLILLSEPPNSNHYSRATNTTQQNKSTNQTGRRNRSQSKRPNSFRQRIILVCDQSTTSDLAKILLSAVAIITLPPLFFFNSLFYTDAGSLLFTLLAYLFSINDHHWLAALSGAVSIFFRQTNIVWLFYAACLVILRTIDGWRQKRLLDESNTNALPPRKNSLSKTAHSAPPGSNNPYCLLQTISQHRVLLFSLIKSCLPYALVGVLFVSFVMYNKGIVLGDREAHQARLHTAQILYFLGFSAFFGASWIFHPRILKRFLYFIVRSPVMAFVISALIIYIIAFGRYAHPYLLADNRHITFYIWRRILNRHNSYVPYLLTPLYLLTSLSVWHYFRNRGCKRVLLFVFCGLLAIVPNGLLELRYFLIPYIFLRLNAETNFCSLVIEIGQHLAVNIGMHNLFLHKTFHWADSPEIQRIMW